MTIPAVNNPHEFRLNLVRDPDVVTAPLTFNGPSEAFALVISRHTEYAVWRQLGRSPFCPAPPVSFIVLRMGSFVSPDALVLSQSPSLRLRKIRFTLMCLAQSVGMSLDDLTAWASVNDGERINLKHPFAFYSSKGEFLIRFESDSIDIRLDEWPSYVVNFTVHSNGNTPLLVNRHPACELIADSE